MTIVSNLSFLPVILAYQDTDQVDKPKVDSSSDSFARSTKQRDFRQEIINLATGKIKSIDFEIKEDGFKLESILPKGALRNETRIEVTIDGKKYLTEYCTKNPWWINEKDFKKAGFYIQGEKYQEYQSLDGLLKKGSKVSMARPDVPVIGVVVDHSPYIANTDVTGDGQDDLNHGEIVESLLKSKLEELGIRSTLTSMGEGSVENQEDLESYAGDSPDLILLPFSSNAYIREGEKFTKETYESQSARIRKRLKEDTLYQVLEEAASNGSFVFAAAGNHPRRISQFLPGKGVIGVGGKDPSGKIAEDSAQNDFVDIYGQMTHRIDFVLDDDGSLVGFDLNQDAKAEFDVTYKIDVDENTDDIWEFLKPMIGQGAKEVTYSEKEFTEIIAKLKDGYEFKLVEDGDYRIPVLQKGEGQESSVFNLTKVFSMDQYNRVMKELGQSIKAVNDKSRYFLFEDHIGIVSIENGKLERSEKVSYDSTGKECCSLKGTSFAIVDPAIEAAKLGLYWLDLSPGEKRGMLGVKPEISPEWNKNQPVQQRLE